MSLFNFRRGSVSAAPTAASAAQADSVEVIRKRAKHRLIGSAVLVLIGVVGFPLLFDTQPRPIPVDIPIEIPAKGTVKPLVIPAPAAPAEKVADATSLAPKEEILPSRQVPDSVETAPAAAKNEAKPVQKAEVKAEIKAEPKLEPKPEPKGESKFAPKAPAAGDDAARVNALLNGQTSPPAVKTVAAETGGRIVVQVGAFADAAKAHEVRLKLEKAGLKTYTQVADTKGGKRTRVRVGPFVSKADAEKAASKIKTLDLSAAILTL